MENICFITLDFPKLISLTVFYHTSSDRIRVVLADFPKMESLEHDTEEPVPIPSLVLTLVIFGFKPSAKALNEVAPKVQHVQLGMEKRWVSRCPPPLQSWLSG